MSCQEAVFNTQFNAAIEAQMTEAARRAPHVLLRPRLSIDGNQWCAIYGDNLQDGVAGFGDSPEAAMADFDKEWCKPLPKPASAALDNMMARSEWPAFITAPAGGEG